MGNWQQAFRIVVLLLVVPLAATRIACAQAPAPTNPLAALEAIRLSLDQIEIAIKRDQLAVADLVDLRRRIVLLREDLDARAAEITPRLEQVAARLKELGPPPKDGATEDAALAAERSQLTRSNSELDAASKQ